MHQRPQVTACTDAEVSEFLGVREGTEWTEAMLMSENYVRLFGTQSVG